MPDKNAVSQVMAHLRRLALLGDGVGREDGELLGRFVEGRDEAAFEMLVRRHGPMVLGVCRRVLGNQEDAEDAFQATFLVLVRKAASVAPRALVANWLHGVARQTAVRTRALNAKRRLREKPLAALPEPEAPDSGRSRDWQPLLDQELGRLPARYRAVVVLCDLEGRTRKEAARQLGWPEGSVSSRLARGRALLAKRLTRRGLVLSCEGLAFLGAGSVVSAQVPAALVSSTIRAAAFLAAGQTAATTLISAQVFAITEGVLTSMLLTKLKSAATACLVVCALGVGLGVSFLAGQTPGDQGQPVVRQVGQAGQTAPAASKAPEVKLEDLQRRLERLEERIQELTLQNKQLLTNLKQTVAERAGKKEIRIYTLRNLQTAEVADTILALFGSSPTKGDGAGAVAGNFQGAGALGAFGNVGGAQLGQFGMMGAGPLPLNPNNLELDPAKLRVATIERTNTIIVRGEPEDLQLIEGLITKLEALPVPRESKSTSKGN